MTKRIIIEVEQIVSTYNDDNDLIQKVKCIKDIDTNACKSCVFHKTDTCANVECDKSFRPDGLDVHFEYIEL